MTQIVTRAEATALGLKRFYTGDPCKREHVAERFASTGGCVACLRDQTDEWRRNNSEKLRELSAEYRQANLEKIREKARQSYRANRENELARAAKYRRKNKEAINRRRAIRRRGSPNIIREERARHYYAHRAELIEKRAKYRRDHAEQERKNQARYRRENPETVRRKHAKYRYLQPDKTREFGIARRARERSAPGKFTPADWRALLARSPVCYYCKKKFTRTLRPDGTLGPATHDHVIPLSKGGANTPENSVAAHLSCNVSKGAGSWHPVNGQGLLL